MKRIFLFLATNFAVMILLGIVLNVTGLNAAAGQSIPGLLAFSAVVGFTGSFVSLLLSKPMAKWSTGAQVITEADGPQARWLVQTVRTLSERARIGMPEVALYEGPPNAFATGAFKNSALVAVSTGLLQSMDKDEVEAVLGHEVAHIANGDMVTLTLIQGVVNTFVVFLSRIVGAIVDKAVFKTERGRGMGYYITVFVCEIAFGLLASIIVAWFSRRREFRADADAAKLMGGPQPMIDALRRLGSLEPGGLPASVAASGISNRSGFMALFSTHPPLQERIARLQSGR
jgi:heat shock protein HtpX